MASEENESSIGVPSGVFASTHWSVVLEAGDAASPHADRALNSLCQTYWYPLYAYIRRRGFDAHEAQDLTQEFLARLIAKCELPKAGREKGRFRFFLLLRLKHFLINEWERLRAEKRGGGTRDVPLDALEAERRYGLEPAHESSPERIYERRWALTVVDGALSALRSEWLHHGRPEVFDELKALLSAEGNAASYDELGARLGTTAGALRVTVHRLRQRWRELVREAIAETVAGPAEVDAEMRHLLDILRNP